jgi:hypothetical protein
VAAASIGAAGSSHLDRATGQFIDEVFGQVDAFVLGRRRSAGPIFTGQATVTWDEVVSRRCELSGPHERPGQIPERGEDVEAALVVDREVPVG